MGLQVTPLNSRHRELGGRMVPFAGWEMPVQFASIIEEHLAVRTRAGLFDVSHMGEIMIEGKNAPFFLDKMTCNHVASMEEGQVRYNAILNEQGGLLDDVTIYRLSRTSFFMVSNASNCKRVVEHLLKFAESGVAVEDQSAAWHLLAVQGPSSEKILAERLGRELNSIKYYRFTDISLGNAMLRISRTGYTGEDGFEIYSDNETGVRLWDELLEQGRADGIVPAGLGARDTLRLEALYPLYGHELNERWTPPESGIGWIAREKEVSYPGYEKIMDHKKNGPPGRVCPILMQEPGIAREGYSVYDSSGENEIGRICSGAYSPVLKKGIATAYLPSECIETDREVLVEIRSKKLKAVIRSGPFVKGTAGSKA